MQYGVNGRTSLAYGGVNQGFCCLQHTLCEVMTLCCRAVHQDLSLFADSHHLSLGSDIDFGLRQLVAPPSQALEDVLMAGINGGVNGRLRHSLPGLVSYLESQPEVRGSTPCHPSSFSVMCFLGVSGQRFLVLYLGF